MLTLSPDPATTPVWVALQTRWRRRGSQLWRAAFVLALGLALWGAAGFALFSRYDWPAPRLLWWACGDPALGLAAMALTYHRRRYPFAAALITALISVVSATAFGASILCLASAATHRRLVQIAALVATQMLVTPLSALVYPDPQFSTRQVLANALFAGLFSAVVGAVGYATGSRRELLASLVDRAETAEREQEARELSARNAERARIAREMHDVLAHRISLVAMHASVLTYRDSLSGDELRTIGSTIEENAREALGELRDVLGVLRDPQALVAESEESPEAPDRPQPELADLPDLVAEANAAGQVVTLTDGVAPGVPVTTGRTVYRAAQEAITNARKHAPGSAVRVEVSGDPEAGLTLRVHNGSGRAVARRLPGSGLGLVGLAERVALAGGTLEHGPLPGGGYDLAMWLPWRR